MLVSSLYPRPVPLSQDISIDPVLYTRRSTESGYFKAMILTIHGRPRLTAKP